MYDAGGVFIHSENAQSIRETELNHILSAGHISRVCRIKLLFLPNDLPQFSHLYGFWSV